MEKRYLVYRGLYLALALSLLFLFVIFWKNGINGNSLLLSLMTLNFNISFILLITFVIINLPIAMKRRFFLFTLMSVFFIVIYLLNFFLYLTRGEGLRLQLVLFTYRFTPFITFVLTLVGIVIVLFIFAFFSSKFMIRRMNRLNDDLEKGVKQVVGKTVNKKIKEVDVDINKTLKKIKKVDGKLEKIDEKVDKKLKKVDGYVDCVVKKLKRSLNRNNFLIFVLILFFILSNSFVFLSDSLLLKDDSNANPFFVRLGSSFYDVDYKNIFYEDDVGSRILDFEINNTRQNVLVVLVDTLGYDKIGYYGYERNTTPNVDRLAKRAIVFWNAFSTSSHSDYSQTAFLSSRHTLINNQQNFFYEYPRRFAWDVLKDEGYSTAYFGSQDDNWAYINYYWNTSNLDVYRPSLADGEYDYGGGKAKKDYDEKTSRDAIEWLNETEESFFLYVNFQAPHKPYSYPEDVKNSYFLPDNPEPIYTDVIRGKPNHNRYDNAVRYADRQFGKIVDFIESEGKMNNTVIVFTTDHGEDLLHRHNESGHGMSVYNEEMHVPLVLYIPGVEHQDIYDNVAQIDFFPTLFDLLDYSTPEEFQGKIMRENNRIIFYIQSFRYMIGSIKDNIKLIFDMHGEEIEVYNLTEDPEELNDLVDSIDYSKYFNVTMSWYSCQMEYYDLELWNEGIIVPDC